MLLFNAIQSSHDGIGQSRTFSVMTATLVLLSGYHGGPRNCQGVLVQLVVCLRAEEVTPHIVARNRFVTVLTFVHRFISMHHLLCHQGCSDGCNRDWLARNRLPQWKRSHSTILKVMAGSVGPRCSGGALHAARDRLAQPSRCDH